MKTESPLPAHTEQPVSPPVTTSERCVLCNSAQLRTLTTPGRWIGPTVFAKGKDSYRLSECGECGLAFVNPRPASETLGEFYGSTVYDCHRPNDSDARSRKAQFLLSRIDEHMGHKGTQAGAKGGANARSGGRLLDYGCGGGYFLKAASQDGWDAVGFDVGDVALKACRAQGLATVDALEKLAPGSFSVILLNHVFEHLEDTQGILARLRTLLAPEGRLFIECPNVGSLRARLSAPFLTKHTRVDERYRAFPIHLYYFDRKTLPLMIERAGFTVRAVETSGVGLDEILYDENEDERALPPVTRKKRGLTASVRNLAAKVVKRALFDLRLGENIMVVAQA